MIAFKVKRRYGIADITLTNDSIRESVGALTGRKTVRPADIIDIVYLTGNTEAGCECGAIWDCSKSDTGRAIAGHVIEQH